MKPSVFRLQLPQLCRGFFLLAVFGRRAAFPPAVKQPGFSLLLIFFDPAIDLLIGDLVLFAGLPVDLSNRRAAAVKNLLVSAFGIPEDQLTTIGLGFEADPFVRGQDRDANGKFVESEGAKNRRVIVMDANDPIAQELLGA